MAPPEPTRLHESKTQNFLVLLVALRSAYSCTALNVDRKVVHRGSDRASWTSKVEGRNRVVVLFKSRKFSRSEGLSVRHICGRGNIEYLICHDTAEETAHTLLKLCFSRSVVGGGKERV